MLAGILNGSLGVLIHEGTNGPLMIWRVQDADGRGPYRFDVKAMDAPDNNQPTVERSLYRFIRSGDKYEKRKNYTPETVRKGKILIRFNKDPRADDARYLVADMLQPTPGGDFELDEWKALPDKTRNQYKFGFPTKGAAVMWFGPRRIKMLEAEGFKLVQVPARRVVLSKSGRQLIFVPWDKPYNRPPTNYMTMFRKRQEESRRQREADRRRIMKRMEARAAKRKAARGKS